MGMNQKKMNMTNPQIVDHLSILPDSTAQVGFQIDLEKRFSDEGLFMRRKTIRVLPLYLI